MSDLNKRCLESWHKVLPDYQVREWNETNSPRDNPYSKGAFEKELWSKLSNLVRFQAVYAEGGIYLDTDVEVLKSFDPLLDCKCFVGFQAQPEQPDWVNTAVLGGEPGHPFLRRNMDMTQKLFASTGKFYRAPTVTTMLLKEMGLQEYGLQQIEDVTVYPLEYFYPFPWTSNFSANCIKANTYCIHHWEGTWVKKRPFKILSPLRTVKRMISTRVVKAK